MTEIRRSPPSPLPADEWQPSAARNSSRRLGATLSVLISKVAAPFRASTIPICTRSGADSTFNMELRWDGVPSLADALRMLKEQARRTPPPQWVRVVGGWTEFQFAERRMPTLEEINQVAPETPVFVLHLYDRALVNGAALRAMGYTRETPEPPAGEIQRDKAGNPTGLLIAKPNAMVLYASLAKGPKLAHDDQVNSTRLFMRELNRLGLTSVIDAGGGFQNYPEDYQVIEDLGLKGATDPANRLQPLHPASQGRTGGFLQVAQDDLAGKGR